MTQPENDRLAESGTAPMVQMAAMVIGAVFLLVGVAGFIPGITTGSDRLDWAGHDSGALLLDIFAVSILHNTAHIAVGIAGLVLARTAGTARVYLLGGGVLSTAIWLYGVLIDHHGPLNVLPVNGAANWLHLAMAAAMLGCGLTLGGMMTRSDPV